MQQLLMRRQNVAFLLLAALCLGIAIIAARPRNDGPVYKGETLHSWLRIYSTEDTGGAQSIQASNAVMQIGTNGLPWLVKQIRMGTSKTWMDRVADRLPYSLARALARIRPKPEFETRFDLAAGGFKLLGTNAAPALPALRNILENTSQPNTAATALFACAQIGKDAVPIFTEIITNTQHPRRLEALAVLQSTHLHTNNSEFIRVVGLCTSDPDPNIASLAKSVVGGLTNTAPATSR
jgi:hypothetical protein